MGGNYFNDFSFHSPCKPSISILPTLFNNVDIMDVTQRELTEEQTTRLQEIQRLKINLNETFYGTVERLTMEIRDVEMSGEESIDRLRGKFNVRPISEFPDSFELRVDKVFESFGFQKNSRIARKVTLHLTNVFFYPWNFCRNQVHFTYVSISFSDSRNKIKTVRSDRGIFL